MSMSLDRRRVLNLPKDANERYHTRCPWVKIIGRVSEEISQCLLNKSWMSDALSVYTILELGEIVGNVNAVRKARKFHELTVSKPRRRASKEIRESASQLTKKIYLDRIKSQIGGELFDLMNDRNSFHDICSSARTLSQCRDLFCSVPPAYLRRKIKDHGIKIHRKYSTGAERQDVDLKSVLAMNNTTNLAQISEEVGISVFVLKRAFKEAGLIPKVHDLNLDYNEITKNRFINRIGNNNYNNLNSKRWLVHQHKTKSVPEIATSLGVSSDCVWRKMRTFGIQCNLNHGTSSLEKEIISFVTEIYSGKIIERTKRLITNEAGNKCEIDIYLPDISLAIEVNGDYWHSFDRVETTEERRQHSHKYYECETLGIQLLTIYEYQWRNVQSLKDFLRYKIQGASVRIFGRKTTVNRISYTEAKTFFEKNHLQGSTSTQSICYGLSYNDEIVSVMSFSKARFSKDHNWELMRFATASDMLIIGGASKLLSHFRKHHSGSIVSYSDNEYSSGAIYETLGFTLARKVPPRYRYIKNGIPFNRMMFQKKKLPNVLDIFDSNLTEAENMFANRFRRIWDCGKKVWTLE